MCGYRSKKSQLVELLHDPRIDLKIFKKEMKNLKVCEEVLCTSMKESITNDGLHGVLVGDGGRKIEVHGTLCVNNICEVF